MNKIVYYIIAEHLYTVHEVEEKKTKKYIKIIKDSICNK